MPEFSISQVSTEADIADTIRLVEAYADWLEIDLTFQQFDAEKRTWPGKYTPPTGALLVARNCARDAVGCVALRPLDKKGVCEMKRLYVDPKGRGLGLGRALAVAIIEEAKRLDYQVMRLDTLPSMNAAIGLYKALGFVEVEAYYSTPIERTVFLELPLQN